MLFGTGFGWIVLAAVIYFAAGAVWYSPVLFAKQWAAELGKKPGDMGDARNAMIVTFIAMLVLTIIEGYIIQATGTHGLWRGAYLGAKLWLGFAATTALINNAFQGGSRKLYLIDQGYHLVGMLAVGAILGLAAK